MKGLPRRPRLVILDAGGVLLLPSPGVVARTLSARGLAIKQEHVVRAHYLAVAALDAAGGEPTRGGPTDTFVPSFAAELVPPGPSRIVATDALRDIFAGPATRFWTRVVPGTRDGIRALVATGVDVAVVSNSDGSVEELLRSTGVCQVGEGRGVSVRAVVDSSLVGVEKPSPAIFRVAMQAAGLDDPAAVAHVGDSVRADVEGAQRAGITPLHFDPLHLCGAADHRHVAGLAAVADWVASAPPEDGS